MATMSDTDQLRATDREPRLALCLTLERAVAGLPSVAELASLIGVVTMIFELADADGVLRATVGRPLTVWRAHAGPISALAVPEADGAPLIISAANDGPLRSWRLDGSPGKLAVARAHRGGIIALAVVEHESAPLIISAGADRFLRSWRLDGSPGELAVAGAHRVAITALAVIEHNGVPLIVSGGDEGALRSWRLDGSPGELRVARAHYTWITALAVIESESVPLIISAAKDGWLRSWGVDGSPGELAVGVEPGLGIRALAVVEHDGAPLIISTDNGGSLRSWRADGSAGDLNVARVHRRAITAVAVIEHEAAPLIISGGDDGSLRSSQIGPKAWARLGSPLAAQLQVRRLSLGSLQLEVLVPVVSAVPAALGFVLYAFKRLWTFPIELRIHTARMQAKLIQAEDELKRLETTREVDNVVEAARDAVIEVWRVTDATLSDDEHDGG